MRSIAILTMALLITSVVTLGNQYAYADTFPETFRIDAFVDTTATVELVAPSTSSGPTLLTDPDAGTLTTCDHIFECHRFATHERGPTGASGEKYIASTVASMLKITQGNLVDGKTTLLYDNNGAGLGMDITEATGTEITGFTMVFASFEAGGVSPITITMTDNDGDTAICTNPNVTPGLDLLNAMIMFPLSCFTGGTEGINGAGFNKANIDSIEFVIDPAAEKNFNLDFIRVKFPVVVGGIGDSMNPVALLVANLGLAGMTIIPVVSAAAIGIGSVIVKRNKQA